MAAKREPKITVRLTRAELDRVIEAMAFREAGDLDEEYPCVAVARNVHGVPRETIFKMADILERNTLHIPAWWPHEVRNLNLEASR